jgi:hypothetical protein
VPVSGTDMREMVHVILELPLIFPFIVSKLCMTASTATAIYIKESCEFKVHELIKASNFDVKLAFGCVEVL